MRQLVIGIGVLLLAGGLLAQFGGRNTAEEDRPKFPKDGEFHFVRVQYTDTPGRSRFGGGFGGVSRRGRASGWWAQDWPDAEDHFSLGIQRLTRINVGEEEQLPFTTDEIFDYPWSYLTQSGNIDMRKEETDRMKEYLLRGGFLVTDDMWGDYEKEIFTDTMQRVFPGQQMSDIGEADQIMHVLYDIQDKDRTAIPGTRHLDQAGNLRLPAGSRPEWYAFFDPKGRMVVAVNYDTDVGDAWEYADVPWYPAAMTTLAYRYGINYIVYAVTH